MQTSVAVLLFVGVSVTVIRIERDARIIDRQAGWYNDQTMRAPVLLALAITFVAAAFLTYRFGFPEDLASDKIYVSPDQLKLGADGLCTTVDHQKFFRGLIREHYRTTPALSAPNPARDLEASSDNPLITVQRVDMGQHLGLRPFGVTLDSWADYEVGCQAGAGGKITVRDRGRRRTPATVLVACKQVLQIISPQTAAEIENILVGTQETVRIDGIPSRPNVRAIYYGSPGITIAPAQAAPDAVGFYNFTVSCTQATTTIGGERIEYQVMADPGNRFQSLSCPINCRAPQTGAGEEGPGIPNSEGANPVEEPGD